MKKVVVNDAGVKLNGKWHFKGQEAVISNEEAEANKEFVTVLEDIRENNERVVEIVVKDENVDINVLKADIEQFVENYGKENISSADSKGEPKLDNPELKPDSKEVEVEGNNQEKPNPTIDEELEELKEKAKTLGIKGAHNMKKETLVTKIEEIEKAGVGEGQNPDGE